MFNFINGLVLPFLAAALIPLILHLLNRQKLKTIPFSSLRFLKELQNKRIRQVKIYQILIIIIRMLFIVFLVLTFARPTLKSLFSARVSRARSTAVILLDNSLSMQARPAVRSNFEKAKDLLRQVLATYGEKDHVFIITGDINSGQPLQLNYNESFDYSQLKVSNFDFHLGSSLQRAKLLFEQFPNYNKELILISDGRWPTKSVSDSTKSLLKNMKCRMIFLDVNTEPFDNLSLDSASVASRIIELHQPVRIQAFLRNQSDQEKESYLSLFNKQTRLAMQLVRLAPHELKSTELAFSPNAPGQYDLTLELDDDQLMADNHYYLTLNIPHEIKILYVYRALQTEIAAAFQALSAKSNLKITMVGMNEWLAQPVSEYQLLVFDDPVEVGTAQLAILRQFLALGKNIVILPGSAATLTDYNQILNRLVRKKPFIELIRRQTADQFFTIKQTVQGEPFLQAVLQPRAKKVDWPHFYQYFKLRRMGPTLFEFSTTDPFLQILKGQTKGQIFLFSAGLSRQWGDFPFRGLFIPFLHQLFALATYTVEENVQAKIGSPLTITLPQIALKADFQLIKPDDQSVNIIPQQTDLGLSFSFLGFNEPGHYKMVSEGKVLKTIAINLDAREWQEPFLKLEQIRNDLITFSDKDFSPQALQKARLGKELWPFFLSLALLMLALEMWLIRKLEQG